MKSSWNLVLALIFTTFLGRGLSWQLQWPFNFQSFHTLAASDETDSSSVDGGIKRIAIIGMLPDGSYSIAPKTLINSSFDGPKWPGLRGAGAAGSSTAYHLQKFTAYSGVSIEITVFERSSYVGGRSTTINAYNNSNYPVELGASIFVEVNTILKNATEQFGLHADDSDGDEEGVLGIWDGGTFVYTQKGSSWWNTAKMLWKYGLAPIRTQRLMKSTVGRFRKLYEAPFFPFRSLSDRALDLDLTSITGVTGEQLLTANGITAPFTTDIIQASTRVNYGQNLGLIHGLETMVCMAIEGAMSVEGGNWQIFDGMVKASNSTLRLNTTVSGIKKKDGKYHLKSTSYNSTSGFSITKAQAFDTVVLAAPLQFSDIELEKDLLKRIPDKIPYVKLHVTLFTSISKLNPVFFKLPPGSQVPDSILTTLPPGEAPSDPEDGVGPAGFFSISTLRTVVNPKTVQKEYLYKIFSPKKITPGFLSQLLDAPMPEDLNTINQESGDPISWYYPHVWNSYPYEYPRVTFEDPELARGFYYTSGMESFISTMETNALMGMNVAQLIVDDYMQVIEQERVEVEALETVVMSESMDVMVSQPKEDL